MELLKAGGADTGIKNANGHTPADVIMINFDEFLDDYAHTSLNLSADRQLKKLEPEVDTKKEPEPPSDSGTDSEIEDEEHLVGWSAPKEEAMKVKHVESQADKEKKQKEQEKEQEKEKAKASASPSSSSKKSPKRNKKKKEKKKKSKKSKRRSKNSAPSDDEPAEPKKSSKSELSPEDRLHKMLTKNENKLDIIREAFSDHDIDDSGYLDKPEFMACLGSLGVQEQFGRNFKDHVNKCFKEFDKDQNGRISKSLCSFTTQSTTPREPECIVATTPGTRSQRSAPRPAAGEKRKAALTMASTRIAAERTSFQRCRAEPGTSFLRFGVRALWFCFYALFPFFCGG